MSNCLLHYSVPSVWLVETTPAGTLSSYSGALSMIAIWLLIICLLVLMHRLESYKKATSLLLSQLKRQQSFNELDIQEAERKRIAADLHDEIGGNLAAIKVTLQSMHYSTTLDSDKAVCLLQLVDETSLNVRRATHNLIPPHFDNTPLTTILREYFTALDNNTGILFHFCCNIWQPHFNARQELVLYRIVMELTSNIIRHAQATAATVQLLYFPDYLELLVEDDGIGLPETRIPGIGLRSIETRVQSLGGKTDIDTGKTGTTFIITIPVNAYAPTH